jgi:hypothetical protein
MSFPIVAKPDNKGFGMGEWTVSLTAGVAITKGLIYAIDVSAITVTSITDDSGAEVGHSVNIGTMVAPAVANNTMEGVDTGIFAVALESASSGDKCLFCFRGVCEVQGGDTSAAGSLMAANTSGKAVIATTGTKGIAYILELNSSDNRLHPALFDGVNGFSGGLI